MPRPKKGPSGWYGIVPTLVAEDRELSKGALRTFVLVSSYANLARWAWPAQATLAERLGAHRRTIRAWLGELEVSGYIRRWPYIRENGGKGSDWILVAPFPDGVTEPPSGRSTDGAYTPPSKVVEFPPGYGATTPPGYGALSAPGDGAYTPPGTKHLIRSLNEVFEHSSITRLASTRAGESDERTGDLCNGCNMVRRNPNVCPMTQAPPFPRFCLHAVTMKASSDA